MSNNNCPTQIPDPDNQPVTSVSRGSFANPTQRSLVEENEPTSVIEYSCNQGFEDVLADSDVTKYTFNVWCDSSSGVATWVREDNNEAAGCYFIADYCPGVFAGGVVEPVDRNRSNSFEQSCQDGYVFGYTDSDEIPEPDARFGNTALDPSVTVFCDPLTQTEGQWRTTSVGDTTRPIGCLQLPDYCTVCANRFDEYGSRPIQQCVNDAATYSSTFTSPTTVATSILSGDVVRFWDAPAESTLSGGYIGDVVTATCQRGWHIEGVSGDMQLAAERLQTPAGWTDEEANVECIYAGGNDDNRWREGGGTWVRRDNSDAPMSCEKNEKFCSWADGGTEQFPQYADRITTSRNSVGDFNIEELDAIPGIVFPDDQTDELHEAQGVCKPGDSLNPIDRLENSGALNCAARFYGDEKGDDQDCLFENFMNGTVVSSCFYDSHTLYETVCTDTTVPCEDRSYNYHLEGYPLYQMFDIDGVFSHYQRAVCGPIQAYCDTTLMPGALVTSLIRDVTAEVPGAHPVYHTEPARVEHYAEATLTCVEGYWTIEDGAETEQTYCFEGGYDAPSGTARPYDSHVTDEYFGVLYRADSLDGVVPDWVARNVDSVDAFVNSIGVTAGCEVIDGFCDVEAQETAGFFATTDTPQDRVYNQITADCNPGYAYEGDKLQPTSFVLTCRDSDDVLFSEGRYVIVAGSDHTNSSQRNNPPFECELILDYCVGNYSNGFWVTDETGGATADPITQPAVEPFDIWSDERGDLASFRCYDGYANTDGSNWVDFTCADVESTTDSDQTGVWDSVTPSDCTRDDAYCSSTFANVDLGGALESFLGSEITVDCALGYDYNGETTVTLTCTDPDEENWGDFSGQWRFGSETDPWTGCEQIQPFCPSSIENSDQTAIADVNNYYTAEIAIECDDGYNTDGSVSGPTTATAICQGDGTWSESCSLAADFCPTVFANINGTVDVSGNALGNQTYIVCRAGYAFNPGETTQGTVECANAPSDAAVGSWLEVSCDVVRKRGSPFCNDITRVDIPERSNGCVLEPAYCLLEDLDVGPASLTRVQGGGADTPGGHVSLTSVEGQGYVVECDPGYGLNASKDYSVFSVRCNANAPGDANGFWALTQAYANLNLDLASGCQLIPDYCTTPAEITAGDASFSTADTFEDAINQNAGIVCSPGFSSDEGQSSWSSSTESQPQINWACSSNGESWSFVDDQGEWAAGNTLNSVGVSVVDLTLSTSNAGTWSPSSTAFECYRAEVCDTASLNTDYTVPPDAGNLDTLVATNGVVEYDRTAFVRCFDGMHLEANVSFWNEGGSWNLDTSTFSNWGSSITRKYPVYCDVPSASDFTCEGEPGTYTCTWDGVFKYYNASGAVVGDDALCTRDDHFCGYPTSETQSFSAFVDGGEISTTELTSTELVNVDPNAWDPLDTDNTEGLTYINTDWTIQCEKGYYWTEQVAAGGIGAPATVLPFTCSTSNSHGTTTITTDDALEGYWLFDSKLLECAPIEGYCVEREEAFNGVLAPASVPAGQIDSVGTFCCLPGYNLSATENVALLTCSPAPGDGSSYLVGEGLWNYPQCEVNPEFCSSNVVGGSLASVTSREINATATLNCGLGYDIAGSVNVFTADVTCDAVENHCDQLSGIWSESCELRDGYCPDPVAASTQNTILLGFNAPPSTDGKSGIIEQEVNLRCVSGYGFATSIVGLSEQERSDNTQATVTCTGDNAFSGVWDGDRNCQEITDFCQESAEALNAENGAVGFTPGDNSRGGISLLVCPTGQTIYGVRDGPTSAVVVCTAADETALSGEWLGLTGEEVFCADERGLCSNIFQGGSLADAQGPLNTDPTQGNITSAANAEATLTCNAGYEVNTAGDTTLAVTCDSRQSGGESTGGWFDTDPGVTETARCSLIAGYCDPAQPALNAEWLGLDPSGVVTNDAVAYQCSLGFETAQNLFADCDMNGDWVEQGTGQPIVCQPIETYCDTDPSVNVETFTENGRALDDVADVICDPGYIAGGSRINTATCSESTSADGVWRLPNNQPVSCQNNPNYCPAYSGLGSIVDGSGAEIGAAPINTAGTLDCPRAYVSNKASSDTTCLESPTNPSAGVWDNVCVLDDTYCPPFDLGNSSVQGSGSLGEEIFWVCETGFSTDGNAPDGTNIQGSSTCEDAPAPATDGVWSGDAPINGCQEVACYCSFDGNCYRFGETVEVPCATGFSVDGTVSSVGDNGVCRGTTLFSLEDNPTVTASCTQITNYCPRVQNALAPSSRTFGTVTQLNCEVGFEPTQADNVSCVENPATDGGHFVYEGTTTVAECQAVTDWCDPDYDFLAATNGTSVDLSDGNNAGSVATITCRSGYASDPSICQNNREWSAVFCEDVDECADAATACTGTCNNLDGGYVCCGDTTTGFNTATGECLCANGYVIGDTTAAAQACVDVDECTAGTSSCTETQNCENTDGGFTCTACGGADELCCADGDACDGGYGCGTTGMCGDLDECVLGTDTCTATELCENTQGSFQCNACGAVGQPCCASDTCNDGNDCESGVCTEDAQDENDISGASAWSICAALTLAFV